MTAAGCSRVLYLVAVLPLLTKLLRKKPKQSIILEGEEDPLLVLDQEVEDTESSQFSNPDQLRKSNEEAQRMRQMHDSNFDLSLSRFSLLIEFAVFIGFAFNTSQTQFIICSFCQALGAGAQPALQSLSLSKVSAQDSGRVLAAMTVCQTLSAQVLGPLAFGGL